ncbi:MAG: hypothetical protein GYA34_11225 [Chloroflexi bacterium]|nr:hypothetical protein [Chloroflexota bacterium]
MINKDLVIFGNKSTALEIFEIACAFYKTEFDHIQMVFWKDDFINEDFFKHKINKEDHEINYIIGFADYLLREKCLDSIKKYSNFKPKSIINPSSYIAPSAIIGKGCYIGANVSISSNAILENFVIINLNASIGHDALIKKNSIILPGARISGHVTIGEGTLVGSNAFIYQGVKVGRENLIDALTYIHDDLPERMISSSRNTRIFKRPF